MKSQFVRFNKLGVLAILLVMVSQVYSATHAVAADHALDERCTVCIVADRADDDTGTVTTTVVSIDSAVFPRAEFFQAVLLSRLKVSVRSRGPPIL